MQDEELGEGGLEHLGVLVLCQFFEFAWSSEATRSRSVWPPYLTSWQQ
jgi:hypothetical protein